MSEKKLPPKPERPVDGECCGGGCEPCVYDYYYEALAKWEAAVTEDNKKNDE